jgi:hypothetical protein
MASGAPIATTRDRRNQRSLRSRGVVSNPISALSLEGTGSVNEGRSEHPLLSVRWAARSLVGLSVVIGLWLLGAGTAFAGGEEGCFTAKINAARGSRGALTTDGALVTVARRHSQRMANSGTIYHNGNLASEAPSGWKSLGENVGMGPTCDDIHNAFMNSPSHRANILDPDFNFVGVGVVIAGDGTIFVTEVFMQKEASQPAQNAPAPTKPSAPKAAPKTPSKPASKPQPAPEAPPPPVAEPPPPPPGERVKGQTKAYLDSGILAESLPSVDQQTRYDQYVNELQRRRKELAKLDAARHRRVHSAFSRLAALIAGAFSATV